MLRHATDKAAWLASRLEWRCRRAVVQPRVSTRESFAQPQHEGADSGVMQNPTASRALEHDDDRWGKPAVEFKLTWSPLSDGGDQKIIVVIAAEAAHGESAHTAFRNKEIQLAELFARLTVTDARALHRRLTIPAKDDPVAARFGRLTKDRRDRLTAFLADARRRQALAAAGRR